MRFTLATVLIIVGFVFLFTNVGIISNPWGFICRYWSSILVLLGIEVLLGKDRAKVFFILLNLALLGFFLSLLIQKLVVKTPVHL